VRASKRLGRFRWVALIGVFALVAAACQTGGGETTTTVADGETTTTGVTETTTAPATGFTYRLGIFQDTTTDNVWNLLDDGSTVWNSYVLTPTYPTLYTIQFPGIEVVADLAAEDEPPAGAAEGDGWAIEVPMREDVTWSDGTPITANDVVFTFETVRDLELGGDWLANYPLVNPENPDQIGLTGVEAVDDHTVKFSFNIQPGLAIWPHGPGVAPVQQEAFWGPVVEEATASEDPKATLYAASGVGNPSGGPVVFAERQEGAFARNTANADYYDFGKEIMSGGVNYTQGPFLGEAVFSLYGGQDAAVLALKNDEVDYLLNPLGMQRGLLNQVEGDESLQAVVNPTNGFRYLAFNLRKEPMSIPQFRDALALMIDKEFMANNVLQGVAFPLYASVPEGNTKWYNEEVANEIASEYEGKPADERMAEAVALLQEAGFAWEQEPTVDVAGTGLTLNGAAVPALEIMAPGPAYDPLRATYSIWIETWLNQLGFDANANPTDFNAIVNAVFVPNDEGILDYDMYILGWSLGNPAFPTYHESFWSARNDTLVNDGNNNTGFNNPEYEALIDQLNATQDEAAAYDIMWELERILAVEKPYILLFDTGILEFYRIDNVNYPFEQSLSGLQFLSGMQGVVSAGAR
jgi:peptide/nickel transport system substrate-binding protein